MHVQVDVEAVQRLFEFPGTRRLALEDLSAAGNSVFHSLLPILYFIIRALCSHLS
jgi:hypothetical protein